MKNTIFKSLFLFLIFSCYLSISGFAQRPPLGGSFWPTLGDIGTPVITNTGSGSTTGIGSTTGSGSTPCSGCVINNTITATVTGDCVNFSSHGNSTGCGTATPIWVTGTSVCCPSGYDGSITAVACQEIRTTSGCVKPFCKNVTLRCGEVSIFSNPTEISHELSLFKAYPNPARDNLFLNYKLPETVMHGSFTLVNMQGEVLLSRSLNTYAVQERIDLSNVPRGICFLNVQADGIQIYQTKVVLVD